MEIRKVETMVIYQKGKNYFLLGPTNCEENPQNIGLFLICASVAS